MDVFFETRCRVHVDSFTNSTQILTFSQDSTRHQVTELLLKLLCLPLLFWVFFNQPFTTAETIWHTCSVKWQLLWNYSRSTIWLWQLAKCTTHFWPNRECANVAVWISTIIKIRPEVLIAPLWAIKPKPIQNRICKSAAETAREQWCF